MSATPADLSLLRFLQDRLNQDIELIVGDTPLVGVGVKDAEFERRFLDRAGLINRVRTELTIVSVTVDSMRAEQGPAPVDANSFEGGPVTALGSELLKLLAARYSDHSDYRSEWRPNVQLP